MNTEINMTNSQVRALYDIIRMVDKFDHSHGSGEYEIKRYEVKDCEFFISVIAEVGLVGDEGTLAQAFCRDRVHLFVGKRGGITYPVYNSKTCQTVYKKLKSRMFLTEVSIDQR